MEAAAEAQPLEDLLERQVEAQDSRRAAVSLGLRVSRRESLAIFAIVAVPAAVLGWWLTVEMKVVAFDSAFRALHAYSVFYNAPPKLAAIGFVWPPLMTLSFLPFVAIKPLATSLVALPLYSAFFAALMIVVLNRTLAMLEMPRLPRYALLAAFAINPMIVHYATNGMAEIFVAFVTVVTVDQFLRWERTESIQALTLCGVGATACVLSRYEMLPFAIVLALGMLVVLIVRRAKPGQIESQAVMFTAPILYGVGAWVFFNWLVMGDALHFLGSEFEERFVLEGNRSVAEGGSGGMHASSLTALLGDVLAVNWKLMAAGCLVVPALAVVGLLRRKVVGLVLAALCLVNPVTTVAAVMQSDLSLLQLRFNMRTMPLIIIGIGWLFYVAQGRLRWVVAVVGVVAVAASAPITLRAMETFQYTFVERDFIAAIEHGRTTDPTGVAANQRIADYIVKHATGPRSVLVDDAQTYMPLLLSGRPDLFFDRVDRGDDVWANVADHPFGRVQWMLMPRNQGVIPDLLLQRYPGAPAGKEPLLRPRFHAGSWVVIEVKDRPTTRRAGP